MRGGHRNMYYATGMPGWMRLGYSPGWVGRSPGGLPPTVQYMGAGTWQTPQPQATVAGIQANMPVIPIDSCSTCVGVCKKGAIIEVPDTDTQVPETASATAAVASTVATALLAVGDAVKRYASSSSLAPSSWDCPSPRLAPTLPTRA